MLPLGIAQRLGGFTLAVVDEDGVPARFVDAVIEGDESAAATLARAVVESAIEDRRCAMLVQPEEAVHLAVQLPGNIRPGDGKRIGRNDALAAANGGTDLGANPVAVSLPRNDGVVVAGAAARAAVNRLVALAQEARLRLEGVYHVGSALREALPQSDAVLLASDDLVRLTIFNDPTFLLYSWRRGQISWPQAAAEAVRRARQDGGVAPMRVATVGFEDGEAQQVATFCADAGLEPSPARFDEHNGSTTTARILAYGAALCGGRSR